MNSKRGIIGGIMTTFIATVIILIIILVFVLASGVIKKVSGDDKGVQVFDEYSVGLWKIHTYLPDYYSKVTRINFLVRQGKSFEAAAQEVGYGR